MTDDDRSNVIPFPKPKRQRTITLRSRQQWTPTAHLTRARGELETALTHAARGDVASTRQALTYAAGKLAQAAEDDLQQRVMLLLFAARQHPDTVAAPVFLRSLRSMVAELDLMLQT